jgi:hypothetical protein
MGAMTRYGEPGLGSAIIETQLVSYGMNFDFVAVGDVFRNTDSRTLVQVLNPLGQIPTSVLSAGRAMTESAAIEIYLWQLILGDHRHRGPLATPSNLRSIHYSRITVASKQPRAALCTCM